MKKTELEKDLQTVSPTAKAHLLGERVFSRGDISGYFADSYWGYTLVHSRSGSVHLAINRDGRFSKKGYLEQPRAVEEVIAASNAAHVVEFGSGRGFNLVYLARLFPTVSFTGIDISLEHLRLSTSKAGKLPNVRFVHESFESARIESESAEVLFEIESICYAEDMAALLRNIWRILKKKGLFVSFNGFRKRRSGQMRGFEEEAVRLVERAMAVNKFLNYEEWLNMASDAGFEVVSTEDLSEAVIPNARRYRRLASLFFRYPVLTTVLRAILPRGLTRNAVAGYLILRTLETNLHGYYGTVLRKKG